VTYKVLSLRNKCQFLLPMWNNGFCIRHAITPILFSGEVLSQKIRLKAKCILINATIQPLQIKTVLTLAAEYVAHVFVGQLLKTGNTKHVER
jgi:hypothetical protein